ncbi:MAG: FtsH protease activity modulator HflK [Halobacteriovoraceae bacterium]|nr:FtsH protease activity modulator HflK [Halobacteriovoraceae bacterium]
MSFNSNQPPNPELEKLLAVVMGNFGKFITFIIGLSLFLGATTCYYTVQPDEQAILIRLGKYIGTYGPGIHFKMPFFIDNINKVKTKSIHLAEFGFKTSNSKSRVTQYSGENYDDEALMVTGDLNIAEVEWVVQYQISDPFKFLYHTSSPLRNIRDVSESVMRRVVGDKLVSEVLTTGRTEISINAKTLMQEILEEKYDMGVRIVSVKLQDVNPPDVVKASFNEVNKAKQEQEKVINMAEEQYNSVIPEARGKAEKLVSEAEGYATAIVNRAQGDANRFLSVLEEYKKAPEITRKRIYLETMQTVFKNIKDVTVVDSNIKGLMPIFSKDGLKRED